MAATLQLHLTGGASNSDPDASLGGVHSSNQISATALNNLFDNVSAAEASAGDTEYRALDLYNAGDAGAVSVQVWSDGTTSADTDMEIGAEGTADTTTSVADESTAPGGVTFGVRRSGSELSTIDIPTGSYVRLWFKRVVSAAAGNIASDSDTIRWSYA